VRAAPEATSPPLTARRLNRATLARQLLLRRERLDAVAAVRRVLVLQAQEPASPYIALWNRVEAFDPAELDAAFADQRVVRTQLFRITLHAVADADYPPLHEAMQPTLRAARLNDPRFRGEGVSVEATEALVPELLAFTATPRSNAEVEAWLRDRFGAPKPRIWWALRQYAPFVHAGTGGPWTFGPRPAYVGARRLERPDDAAASARYLVRRYLEAFGPATMQDIAQFSTILRPPIQAALRSLADELDRYDGPNGEALIDLPGGPLPAEDTPAPPRLLPMWDSVLLAHAGRSRVVPADCRGLVVRKNGDVLPTLLVDGLVAGVWRPLEGGIEASAFQPLPDDAWNALDTEARALRAFLADRDPKVFGGRYAHWWSDLPAAEVRLIGA
jgi:hypothetical protein